MSYRMSLLAPILLGFVITVVSVWLKLHLSLSYPWLNTGLPFLCFSGLTLLLTWCIQRFFALRSLTWPRLLLTIILLVLGLFHFKTWLWPWLISTPPIVSSAHAFSGSGFLILTLFQHLIFFLVLTLLFLVTGRLVIARFSHRIPLRELSQPLSFFLTFSLGLFFIIVLLLLLSAFNLLTQPWIIFLILSLFGLGSKYLKESLLLFWRTRFPVPQAPSLHFFLGLMLLLLLALNFSETIRPVPTGYDDATVYFDRVHQMTTLQALLSLPTPFPFETLATATSLAVGETDQRFALLLGVYGLFFGVVVIFSLLQSWYGARLATLGSLILLSLPMGPALSLFETKPDSFVLPLFLISLWLFITWWQTRILHWLYYSFFIFGLASSFKLTLALFLPGLLIASLWKVWRERDYSVPSIKTFLFLPFALILPFLPWYIHFEFSPTTPPSQSLALEMEELRSELACVSTGASEDFARFDQRPTADLLSWITLPWDMTMNTQVNAFATEIGFLFLILLPCFLLLKPQAARENSLPIGRGVLVWITLAGLLLWACLGQQVTWYFYPALAPLTLLTIAILRSTEARPGLYYFFLILILLSIASNTLIRLKFAQTDGQLRFMTGELSATEYFDAHQPGYAAITTLLNQDPEKRVYMTNSRLWYGLDLNHKRVYMDNYLDTFNCLFERRGPLGVLDTWRDLDIHYVLINKYLFQQLKQEHQLPSYQKKIERLVEFATHGLQPIWQSAHYIILIPNPLDAVSSENSSEPSEKSERR